MEKLNPCPCGVQTCTATRHERTAQIRRGARLLEVSRAYWRCSECRDPLSGDALEVIDAELSSENEERAREAWKARFQEELPPAGPPGRKPGRTREQRVTILLTDEELADLDRRRGELTRSDFIRESVLHRHRAS